MNAANVAALLAAGAATGTLGALLGVGGGVFLVPALVLWFGVPMGQAAASGLIAVIATSSAAASSNVENGVANMRLGMAMETVTVLGALTGGIAAAHLPARLLIGLFGVLLASVGVLLWRDKAPDRDRTERPRGPLDGRYYDPALERVVGYSVRRLPAGLAASFAAGNLSGLLGVGGGIIKVPALHLLCGVPIKAAAATSNFTIGVTATAGALLYAARGDMDPTVSGIVTLGVMAGSAGGAALSRRLPDRSIRKAFALLTALLATQMLSKAIHG